MILPDRLLELLAARVARLDASPYRQVDADAPIQDAWNEDPTPYTPSSGASTRHLSFAVVPVTSRPASTPGPRSVDVGEELRAASQVDVIFEYVLRHDTQNADMRLALLAARDVVAAINDESSWAQPADDAEVHPTDLGTPSPSPDGTSVRVRTSFLILHEYGV